MPPLRSPALPSRGAGALLAVLLSTFALYAPSLGNRFASDDRFVAMAVRDDGAPNAMVAALQPLPTYFTTNYWQGVYPGDVLYRPVTALSHALTYAGVGRHLKGEAGEALPQHALNIALHLCAVWLVYRLLLGLRLDRGPALLGAMVFGVHAVHSEVVASVVGRAELLGFCCGAGATLSYAASFRHGGHRRVLRLAGAAALFFLAFGSKENALAWAPLAVVYRLVQSWRAEPQGTTGAALRAQIAPVLLAAAVPAALFLVLRSLMIAGLPPVPAPPALEFDATRIRSGIMAWGYAALVCLWPFHLAYDHGAAVFEPVRSTGDLRLWAAALLLVALLVAGLWRARRRALAFLAAACFFGCSFATTNIPFRVGVEFAERLYYTPSLGLSVAVAGLAAARPRGAVRAVALAVLAAWTLWSCWMVLQRNPVWANDRTLYEHEVQNQPRSARTHYNWAQILEREGNHAAALEHHRIAAALNPALGGPWNQLAALHAARGDLGQALACLQRARTAADLDATTRDLVQDNLVQLGAALAQRGAFAQALAAVRGAADMVPALRGARRARALQVARQLARTEAAPVDVRRGARDVVTKLAP